MAVSLENNCVLSSVLSTVDIKGIDNHHIKDIGISTVGGVVNTQM
jgi:hypothetical protein